MFFQSIRQNDIWKQMLCALALAMFTVRTQSVIREATFLEYFFIRFITPDCFNHSNKHLQMMISITDWYWHLPQQPACLYNYGCMLCTVFTKKPHVVWQYIHSTVISYKPMACQDFTQELKLRIKGKMYQCWKDKSTFADHFIW